MDAYEALKETFDDLFQQAVEEGCYTEDEAAELVESLDIYSLLQVVRHNATTVYSYITQGRQERSFNYRGEDLFRQKATLLYEETDQVTQPLLFSSGLRRSPVPTSRKCWTASTKTPPASGTPRHI